MTVTCYVCHKPFKEDDEALVMVATYFHDIPSHIHYSITEPHHVYKDTFHHRECEE